MSTNAFKTTSGFLWVVAGATPSKANKGVSVAIAASTTVPADSQINFGPYAVLFIKALMIRRVSWSGNGVDKRAPRQNIPFFTVLLLNDEVASIAQSMTVSKELVLEIMDLW
jgi:hypothetical protein